MTRTQYIALSKGGRIVCSFDDEAALRAFVDRRWKEQAVRLDMVVEETVRRPLNARLRIAA